MATVPTKHPHHLGARLALAALLAALAACKESRPPDVTDAGDPSDIVDPFRLCTPNMEVACDCRPGLSGTQTCRGDGRGFGFCVCPDAGAPPDAGDAGEDAPDVMDVPRDVLPDGCAATTPGNCCGVACETANGTPACRGGACAVATCAPDYGDCDGVAANGCETDTRTALRHCGECGAPCVAGRVCVGSRCVVCPEGSAACDGACVTLATDARHCGACGNACGAGRRCEARACVEIPSDAGADVPGDVADGA